MPKAFRHTGVLMMLAVVALGLVGAGYALWYDELTLTANVSTGSFSTVWTVEGSDTTTNSHGTPVVCLQGQVTCESAAAVYHPLVDFTNGTVTGYARVADKLPACSAAITVDPQSHIDGDKASNDSQNGHSNLLTLDIGKTEFAPGQFNDGDVGLYPYAGCKFTIDIDNNGSVPAHLTVEDNGFGTPPPAGDIGVVSTLNGPLSHYGQTNGQALCDAIGQMLDGSFHVNTAIHRPDIGVTAPGVPAVQLHHGEKITCDIIVYLKEVAPETTRWTYSWELIAHQWNEAVGPSDATP